MLDQANLPNSRSSRFHLWMPELLSSKGGIQVYSDYLLAAIQKKYPTISLDIFLKHDDSIPPHLSNQTNVSVHYAGSYPLYLRTLAFATQLLGYGIIHRPDLVIATHLNFTVAAYQLKQLTGTPYWAIAHGMEAWNVTRPDLQIAIRHADRILAVSHYTRDRLLTEQSLDPEKVGLLQNTFNSDCFQIAPKPASLLKRYHLAPNQPVILTVCRLSATEQYKGYDQILAALPRIRQIIPDVHYIIVGKGGDRSRIEQLIAEKNLQDCVTLAGFVPDQELCSYYNLCDLFAMPSKREGFGIVYLEAMACGKPVLAGNQDGSTDALCQGTLGALVNPDDVNEIAQTIIQILQGHYSNPLIYQPEKLRQKVIKAFNFKTFELNMQTQLETYFYKT